jgi:hypothetical protein
VTPGPALDFARLLGTRAQVLRLPSECGHLVFDCEMTRIGVTVNRFLAK